MNVKVPTGSDIAKLLLLCAPTEVLSDLDLSEEKADEFAILFDAMDEYHQIVNTALTLYYCNKSMANFVKSRSIIRGLYFSPEVINKLIQTIDIESFSETDKLKDELLKQKNSENARKVADAKHNKPGGAREKGKEIRDIWASGKYTSRDICAEQEFAGLKWNLSSARKALRNTPDPT